MRDDDAEDRIICDQCERGITIANRARAVTLPIPWRFVALIGWDKLFHACSDRCEAGIRLRYERPKPDVLVESEDPRDDEPTVPERRLKGGSSDG